jgi:hypothetical protein
MAGHARTTDKAAILELEREAWVGWCAHIDGVDPDATRADGWSLKDVVAHIAAWQRYWPGGSRRSDVVSRTRDAGGRGRLQRRRPRGVAVAPWEEVRAEAERAHDAFVSTIEAVHEDAFARDDGLGAFVVAVNGVEHYEEHLPDVFLSAGGPR